MSLQMKKISNWNKFKLSVIVAYLDKIMHRMTVMHLACIERKF